MYRSLLGLLGDLIIHELLQFLQVLIDAQPHIGDPPLVLRPLRLGHLGAAVQHHIFLIGVLGILEVEVAVEPLIACLHAGVVVSEEFSLEAVLLAEVVGVEGFDLQ